MAKITIAACDKCNKHLLTETDGLIIHGYAMHPGSQKAFVGRAEQTREATPAEYYLCWPCWHKVAKDPTPAQARQDGSSEGYSAASYDQEEKRGHATGRLLRARQSVAKMAKRDDWGVSKMALLMSKPDDYTLPAKPTSKEEPCDIRFDGISIKDLLALSQKTLGWLTLVMEELNLSDDWDLSIQGFTEAGILVFITHREVAKRRSIMLSIDGDGHAEARLLDHKESHHCSYKELSGYLKRLTNAV